MQTVTIFIVTLISEFTMRYIVFYLLGLLFFVTAQGVAQNTDVPNISPNVIIKGNAPSYAGETFVLQSYSDAITHTETNLSEFTVDENGNFSASFFTESPVQLFVNLHVFKGVMYATPNETYEVVLPDKVEKTEEDKLNPYFKPIVFSIGTKDTTRITLNQQINRFDRYYDVFLSENYYHITMQPDRRMINNQIEYMDSIFADYSHPYFVDYTYYRYAMLRFLSYERDRNYVIKKYFSNRPVLYNNLAYTELFSSAFDGYFEYLGRRQVLKVSQLISENTDLQTIYEHLENVETLQNDTLKEYVFLHQLKQGVYNETYQKAQIIRLLDEINEVSAIEKHRQIAALLKARLTQLSAGAEVPDFQFRDKNGDRVMLSDFRGSYIYLSFSNTKSYTALKHLELLKNYSEKFAQYFKVVTISTDDNFEEMLQLAREKGYQWPVLSAANTQEVLDTYSIKVLPTYFLISPEGKIVLAPAPSPEENFDQRFGEIWRDRQNQQRRNEYQNQNNSGNSTIDRNK